MLKKISVAQLRLGMHLHALEGPWMAHPFWKTRFILRDPLDLKRLRDSGLRECWIDDELGLVLRADDVNTQVAPRRSDRDAAAAAQNTPAAPVPPQRPAARRAQAEELRQAAVVCQRGRHAVISMFNEARMGRALDTQSCLPLVDDISSAVLRNPGALVSLARLKTQDDYSYMHSVAV